MTKILTLNPAIALSRNGINVLQKASNSRIWANFVKNQLAIYMHKLLIFLILLLSISWIPDDLYAQLNG